MNRDRLSSMCLGGLLVLAGVLIANRPANVARAEGFVDGAGTAPIGMVSCPDDGFVIFTGASGRYFFVNENGKARAVATDAGEFIDWK